jgi:quercetin dioxygenase-like cupin family protein
VERVEVQRDGVRAVKATVGQFALQRLRFAPGHAIPWFEPQWGYLAVVLEGTMQKTFSNTEWCLPRGSFATLPCGAGHSTAFGLNATDVVTLYPAHEESASLFTPFLRERQRVAAPAAAAIGRRLALELEARDTSWGLAAEGLG